MRKAVALATGVFVVGAFAGSLVALTGNTGAALVIWIAGAGLSGCIAFSAPWLLTFLHTDEAGG